MELTERPSHGEMFETMLVRDEGAVRRALDCFLDRPISAQPSHSIMLYKEIERREETLEVQLHPESMHWHRDW